MPCLHYSFSSCMHKIFLNPLYLINPQILSIRNKIDMNDNTMQKHKKKSHTKLPNKNLLTNL